MHMQTAVTTTVMLFSTLAALMSQHQERYVTPSLPWQCSQLQLVGELVLRATGLMQ